MQPGPVQGWGQLLAQGGTCLAQPGLVATGTTGSHGLLHGTGGTWRPLQQKLKISSGTIIFPLTIFKRHLERRRVALVTAGLAEAGVAVSRRGQGSVCGRLSHPVPTAHADVPPQTTDPSPAPIRGLSELKRRRADPGQVAAIPWGSGPTPTSPDERVPAILGSCTKHRLQGHGQPLNQWCCVRVSRVATCDRGPCLEATLARAVTPLQSQDSQERIFGSRQG